MLRRLEVEVERIANVQRKNFVSLSGDFIGNGGQVTNRVADVTEARSGSDLGNLCGRSHATPAAASAPQFNRNSKAWRENRPGIQLRLDLEASLPSVGTEIENYLFHCLS